MPSEDILQKLGDLASALLTLEVNTIVKPGMSAQKMPDVVPALQSIADGYAAFLRGHLIGVHDKVTNEDWLKTDDHAEAKQQVLRTFGNLEAYAEAVLKSRANDPDTEDDPILFRIKSNSRQISRNINSDKEDIFKPTPEFTMLVRKMWDVGIEVVLMQTTLQIDGDVITRVSPGLVTRDSLDNSGIDAAFISQIHRDSLSLATSQWRSLFDLASNLLGDLGKTIFGGGGALSKLGL